MSRTALRLTAIVASAGLPLWAQTDSGTASDERWNLYYQATSIGQYHGAFNSPYYGPLSLREYPERDVSLTTTLFLGIDLSHNTQFYFNGEVAGGRGFSGVDGLANAANGELPRVASATPKPYIARLYITHDFAFGDQREVVESDVNQLAGTRPANRYSISIGRFTVTDFFDDNKYSHDPRTQFMQWGVMYNGAWDYPADVRGYTWGWLHEVHLHSWSFRYASAAEPTVANGANFDRRIFVDRGDIFEVEKRYSIGSHPGAIRLLNFEHHTRSGSYGEALQKAAATGGVPDVSSIRKPGTLKYGFGVNAEQEITKDLGAFFRLGWNDGKTEDFAFTAIDRLASGGFSLAGTGWRRPKDKIGSVITFAGISAVHALYLAHGGTDFLIGDGRLNYAPETTWEGYYSAEVGKGLTVSFDAQHYWNPAYNHDRGPVWAYFLRLHLEGKVWPR